MVTSIVEDSIDGNNKKIDIPGFKKKKNKGETQTGVH